MAGRRTRSDDDAEHELALSVALRGVLGSTQRTELLILLEEQPSTAPELTERLVNPIARRTVQWHLNELSALGWIHVVALKQIRGGMLQTWDLTNRGISWKQFLADVAAAAPRPAQAPESAD